MKSKSRVELAPRSRVYRAELIRCWSRIESKDFPAFAKSLGYEPKEKPKPGIKKIPKKASNGPSKQGQDGAIRSPEPTDSPARFPYWRVTQFEPRERPPQRIPPKWYRDAVPFQDHEWLPPVDQEPPQPLDLMPWRKLWIYLRRALGRLKPNGNLDLEAVVHQFAKGFWPRRMPRQWRLRSQPQAILIADYQNYLEPVWRDMSMLRLRLDGLRSSFSLNTWIVKTGYASRWYQAEKKTFAFFKIPRARQPVLVLGDLGHLDANPRVKESWLALGKALRQAGCLPLALVPLPRHRWDSELARVWHMMPWDRHSRVPRMTKNGLASLRPLGSSKPDVDVSLLEELLAKMAPGIGVEPALLRALRLSLSRKAAIDLEMEAWNHPDLERFDGFVAIDAEHRETYRQKFAEMANREGAKHALSLFAEYHHAWPRGPYFEEQLEGERLLGMGTPATQDYYQRLAKSLKAGQITRTEYMHRMGLRRNSHFWKQSTAPVAAWLKACWTDVIAKGKAVPEGLDPFQYSWLLEPDHQERAWELTWQGEYLLAKPCEPRSISEDLLNGSILLHLKSQDQLAQIQTTGWETKRAASFEGMFQVPLNSATSFSLTTDVGTYTFSPNRAELNARLGHDRHGPFAQLKAKHGGKKLRWLAPGPIRVIDRDGHVVGEWAMQNGCWMAHDQIALFADGMFRQPDWTDAVGADEYGIFAEIHVQGVSQRFRWIFPGIFQMGSPPDEPGRREKEAGKPWTDETQHEVRLTHGFWLGETTVTQELWQAAMGQNPSHFKGEGLPVESVSWEDCTAFIENLNGNNPTLELCLPSEAQWEYASRAGTTTAYHFGDSITTDQVNYNGTRPNDGSPKGIYRQKPVAVGTLPGNTWGLYEMHGNVDEWCGDWLAYYDTGKQVDPQGPDSGQFRVLRGGSWIVNGRYCRSAVRNGDRPVYRFVNFGFRLARGQEALQQAPGRTEVGDRPRSDLGRKALP